MENEHHDSLGALTTPLRSSETTTFALALNAKALGADFERLADSEIVNRALLRLVAVLGAPWGRDNNLARQMAVEWVSLLGDLPAITIDRAITAWLKSESKWPKPADLREIAGAAVLDRVREVSETHKIHEARLKPSDQMIAFNASKEGPFIRSALRSNPTWATFLDSIHPTAEHCFFGHAFVGQFANEISVKTTFEREQIYQRWGDALTAAFGRPVRIDTISP